MSEDFIFVGLQDEQSKHLAHVLSNDTARKILDYLSQHKRATESSLASKLRIPLSTIHYNLKKLVDGGLVKSEEYHYSQKGREVAHYALASEFIIFSHAPAWSLKEKLKGILPMTLIAGGVAWWLQSMQRLRIIPTQITNILPTRTITQTVVQEEAARAAPVYDMMIAESMPDTVVQSAPTMAKTLSTTTMSESVNRVTESTVIQPEPIGLYFFAGFVIAVLAYLAWDWYHNR